MELCLFSLDDGYAESILRGLRAGFLNEVHYNQMKNCSTLSELKSVNQNKKNNPLNLNSSPFFVVGKSITYKIKRNEQ